MDQIAKTYGEILKAERLKNNLTIEEVESIILCGQGYVKRLESNSCAFASVHALYKLCNLYNIELKPILELAGAIIKKNKS